jgi:leucyl aminopeptidase
MQNKLKITVASQIPGNTQAFLGLIIETGAGFVLPGKDPLPVRDLVAHLQSEKVKRLLPVTAGPDCRPVFLGWTGFSKLTHLEEAIKTESARLVTDAKNAGLQHLVFLINHPHSFSRFSAIVEGLLLGDYEFNKYKSRKKPEAGTTLTLLVETPNLDRARQHRREQEMVCGGINLARDLVNEPVQTATTDYLVQTARRIGREQKLGIQVWDRKQLAREGFNGLITVGKAGLTPPYMVAIRYRAPKKSRAHLALVGKGIVFDTGGISLKTAGNMWYMKGDMAGAAAVLGTMQIIGQVRPDIDITGILCLAENAPDTNAARPGDIFYARNGKTVVVENTDAEGRLILTDGLFQAGKEKATHIVDIATLTGACIRALGEKMAGVLGNNPVLVKQLKEAGRQTGDYLWELPLFSEYRDQIDSPYADVRNIGEDTAGTITAALFLQEFVPEKTPWAHLDIAGPFLYPKGWKYFSPGASGYGVRLLTKLIGNGI